MSRIGRGLGGRLPLLDLRTASPLQLELDARIKRGLPPAEKLGGAELTNVDGRLIGPLNAHLYNPVIGEALFKIPSAALFSTTIPVVIREIAAVVNHLPVRNGGRPGVV